MAENAIRLIRTDMKRLTGVDSSRRWWKLMDKVQDGLNSKVIMIKKKRLDWAPKDITKHNVHQFINDLHKADPAYYFGQFEIAPQLVNFKYSVGSIVRPKLIVTSAAVIGEKRSEINLEKDPFIIEEQIPYVNANLEIAKGYKCVNKRTLEEEIFDENDLAESIE
jgi:hypothetical protein